MIYAMIFVMLLMALIGLNDVIIFKLNVWLTYRESKDDIKNYLSKKDFYILKQNNIKWEFEWGGIMNGLINYKEVLNNIVNYLVPIIGAIVSVIAWIKSTINSKNAKKESEVAKKYASEANEYYNSAKKYYEQAQPIILAELVKNIEDEIMEITIPKTMSDLGLIGTEVLYDYFSLHDKNYVDMAIQSLVKKNMLKIINVENGETIRDFDPEKHLLLTR